MTLPQSSRRNATHAHTHTDAYLHEGGHTHTHTNTASASSVDSAGFCRAWPPTAPTHIPRRALRARYPSPAPRIAASFLGAACDHTRSSAMYAMRDKVARMRSSNMGQTNV